MYLPHSHGGKLKNGDGGDGRVGHGECSERLSGHLDDGFCGSGNKADAGRGGSGMYRRWTSPCARLFQMCRGEGCRYK